MFFNRFDVALPNQEITIAESEGLFGSWGNVSTLLALIFTIVLLVGIAIVIAKRVKANHSTSLSNEDSVDIPETTLEE